MSTVSALLLSLTLAATPNPRGEVIDFSATWCGPCQQVAPIVNKLEQEGHSIRTVDTDKDRQLAERYNVSQLPTFVLVVDGRELERHIGKMTEQQLRVWLAKIPAVETATNGTASGEIPVRPAASSQPSAARSRPFVADPNVDLGSPAPFPQLIAGGGRPAPIDPGAPLADPKPAAPKKFLWPFGSRGSEAVQPEYRGNDDLIGQESRELPDQGQADPMQASVRLRVTIGSHVNLGSGTIIYSVQGVARIVTCGHIFRGITEDSKIEVDLFLGGQKQTVVGRVVDYSVEDEIGVIEIPSADVLPTVRIASVQSLPRARDRVQSIGCDGGALPTALPIEVTSIDRYEGASTIECTGVPVQGRSGGGLFNLDGELIGVCFAADPVGKLGIYTGLTVVHDTLRQNGMARLFELPANATLPGESLAGGAAAPDVSSLFSGESLRRPSELPASGRDAGSRVDPASIQAIYDEKRIGESLLTDDDRAYRESRELSTRTTSGENSPPRATGNLDALGGNAEEAEIVLIVRPKNQPESASRVVIINQASPKLLSYLRGDAMGDVESERLTAINSTDVLVGRDSYRETGYKAHRVVSSPTLRRPASLEASYQLAATPRIPKSSIVTTSASQRVEAKPYVRSAESRR
ncbi:MAG: thioredoxin domain-containing protein [Planctomycetaceae bacterium]